MSIFTSLAQAFKKKDKTEQKPKTAAGRIFNIINNAGNPISIAIDATRGNENQTALQRNINRGKKASKGAWGFIQGTLSGVASSGVTIGQELSGIGRSKEERQRIREEEKFIPTTKFERTFLGDKPIGNVRDLSYDIRKTFNKNAKERPLIDYTAGIALGVLDYSGLGSPSKKVATSAIPEIIAGLRKTDEIVPFLKRMIKGSDSEIKTVAKTLENITDPRLIEDELLALSASKKSSIELTKDATNSIKKMRELDAIAKRVNVDEANKVMKIENIEGLTPRQVKNAEAFLKQNSDVLLKEFKDIKDSSGGVLTNKEVMSRALRIIQQDSGLFDVMTKNQQAEFIATMKAGEFKAEQAIKDLFEGDKVFDKDIVEAASSLGTFAGRLLQARKKILKDANPLEYNSIVERLQSIGKNLEEIESSVKDFRKKNGADSLKDPKMREVFLRETIKPKLMDILNEYRYANMLSSPKTHLFNILSNAGQAVLNIPVKLVSGVIDKIGSALTGKNREVYIREVPEYVKGSLNNIVDAFKDAADVLAKGGLSTRRPDIKTLETGKIGPLKYILRAMDAGDIFFRKIIQGGEEASLMKKAELSGQEITSAVANNIKTQAAQLAERAVYRSPLDVVNETGQGKFNSAIDTVAASIFMAGDKVPAIRWFIPFIQTPTQVLKQGLEYTPIIGLANLPGNARKTEIIAKQIIGATITASFAQKALNGDLTWSIPTNKYEKESFYADGRKPYSIKVGDTWVPYNRIGPAGFPIALMGSIAHQWKNGPEVYSKKDFTKMTNVVSNMMQFFADQSYVQGIGDIVSTLQQGEGAGGATAATLENLTRQVIPLSALQGWISRITDKYIWSKRSTFPGNYIDGVFSQLPEQVRSLFGIEMAPRLDSRGSPIERGTKSTNESYTEYQRNVRITQDSKKKSSEKKSVSDAVMMHVKNVDKLKTKEEKIKYAKDLYNTNKEEYDAFAKIIQDRNKKLTGSDARIAALGIKDGSRAKAIVKELDLLDNKEEKVQYIKSLQDKDIITDTVFSQIKYLLTNKEN